MPYSVVTNGGDESDAKVEQEEMDQQPITIIIIIMNEHIVQTGQSRCPDPAIVTHIVPRHFLSRRSFRLVSTGFALIILARWTLGSRMVQR